MKKLAAFLLMLGFLAASAAGWADDMDMNQGGKPQKVTLTGILVDVACYLDDGDIGNDHMGMKGCGTQCLKGGSPAGLLVGKKLYILAFPAPVFADYVGQQVELAGDLYGTSNLIPTKAASIGQDGKKTPINIKGKAMM